MLVLFAYCAGYIDDRKNREDESLQDCYENVQNDENDRQPKWQNHGNVTGDIQLTEKQ